MIREDRAQQRGGPALRRRATEGSPSARLPSGRRISEAQRSSSVVNRGLQTGNGEQQRLRPPRPERDSGQRGTAHAVTERPESSRCPVPGRLPVPARASGSQVVATPRATAADGQPPRRWRVSMFACPRAHEPSRSTRWCQRRCLCVIRSRDLDDDTQMRPSSGSVVETAMRQPPSGVRRSLSASRPAR